MLAPHFYRIMDRTVSRSPADEQRVAFLIAINFRHRNFFGEFAQFVATLRRHGHVQFRAARGMPHLVVFESADERIFSVKDARARRDVLRDTLELIRLEAALAWCEIGLRVDHQLRKIWLVERFDTRGERRVAQNKNRRTVFARDPGRFNRDVETIFDARCCKHNTRTVAVAAEDRLMQIALLNVGGQACAWAAALNVANDEWDLC